MIGEKRKKLKKIDIKYKQKKLELNIKNINITKGDIKKGVKIPNMLTPKLAEEIGMHIGDGYLSDKKREFRLKGNKKDEKEYYDSFVKQLYKDLFRIDLKIKEYESTYGFEIYSTAISEFKSKVIGIPRGRKDNIVIPDIIKVNNLEILTSFLRGLFDTDGNIHFQSRYGYKNYYPLISISQKSVKLIKEICTLLEMLGLSPSFYIGKNYASVSLYGYESLKRYIELIGFHNPKHLKKIDDWEKAYPKLVAMV
ncbi:MAG: LAGLIDADG family homing endonuclease [Nanoarchaeota archaeon]